MPQKQTISIPFATGQQDKQSPVWIDPGTNATVTNGIFVKANQVQKRPGGLALSKSANAGGQTGAPTTLAVTKKLASYRNELLLFDGQYLRSYLSNLNQWITKDEVSPCVATRETIAQISPGVFDGDVIELGGFRVFVWTEVSNANSALYFAVQDTTNGLITSTGYVGNTSATCRRPKLVQVTSTTIALVHQRSSDNAICGRIMAVNAVNPTWGGQTVIIAGASTKANVPFDVSWPGASIFVLAYEDNTGVIRLKEVDSSFSIIVSGTCTDASTTYTAIALRADLSSGLVWLGFSYNGGNDVKMSVYSYLTLAETQAPFSVYSGATNYGKNIGIEKLDSTHAVIVFGTLPGSSKGFQWGVYSSTGATTLANKIGYGQGLLSRPIVVNSLDSVYGVRVYALVSHATPANQTTQFLVELDVRNVSSGVQAAHPVATISPRFSSSSALTLRSNSTLTSATNYLAPSNTSFVTFGSVAESLNGVGAVSAITIDFNHPGAYTCAELGGSLYISGGVPSVYDGNVVAEIGSLVTADGISGSAAAGGSLTGSQTYYYVFIKEWRDYKGQRHQGQPSIPYAVTTTGINKQVTLTVPQINLTTELDFFVNQNVGPPYIVPYRTTYDGTAMTTIYHRLVSDAPGSFAGSVIPSNETFSFTDDGTGLFSDANALAAEQLYTTGGVVEDDCPPSFTHLCAHKGRIFGVADDQRTIWYSTVYSPGAPVRFNDTFILSCEEGGPIVAVAGIEGYLVVFKKDSIYYFTGDGKNVLGEQGDFFGPTRLPVDFGCVDPRSLLLTPQGLVFRTRNGMAMLDRGLSYRSDFGDSIENSIGPTTAAPIVTAVQHPSRPEYWFDVANSASASETNGKAIVYNTRFNAWSTMSRFDSDKSRTGALMCSGISVNGTYYYSTPFGQVYSEYPLLPAATAGQFKDGGTSNYVTLTVETAWIKPSLVEGVQRIGGYGRIWKALFTEEWRDYHNVVVQVAYDYSSSYTDSFMFTAGYHTSSLYEELEVNMSRPLCEAVRLKFTDAENGGNPSTTGEGGVLVGITAEIGVYPGTNRKSDARRK